MLKGPTVAYPEKSPIELVRLQCGKTPTASAVLLPGGKVLRYRDLDTSSLEALVAGISPELAAKHEFLSPKGLDDPALIIQSSGTTGEPKRVIKTNRNMVQRIAWDSPEPGHLQLLYPHGLPRLIVCLAMGAQVAVITDEPHGADRALELVAGSGATHLTLFPWYLTRILNNKLALPSVKEIVTIGSKVRPATKKILADKYPHITFVDGYGSVEAGYCMRDWQPVANASVWVEAEDGQVGPLCVAGPTVGLGYADASLTSSGPGFHKEPSGIVFQSQDMAREVDGKIEFLGRT